LLNIHCSYFKKYNIKFKTYSLIKDRGIAMKKLVTLLTVLIFTTSLMQAQALKDSWSLGFGGSILNYTSTNIQPKALKSFGGYISVQRNFTEHTGLRLYLNFGRLEGSPTVPGGTYGQIAAARGQSVVTTTFGGYLDFVYNFMPCESISPFVTVGLGQNFYTLTETPNDPKFRPDNADMLAGITVGLGVGLLANLSENWKLKTELGFFSIDRSDLDGTYGTEGYGILGANSDGFGKFDVGVEWYFSKGEPSKICVLYDGIEMPDPVDYERLENIIKKHIPREVIKEVVVEKEVPSNNDMLLMGVNYDFNSSKLKPESYPILFHAAKVMQQNPDMTVEIQGYTDNIGSEKANKNVSQKRADSVKNYLVARGISTDRITTVGYGEENPIGDNKDADGRAMNRRIEFKVSK
jgi:OOP family OmpA-OmpF porin